MIKFSIGQLLSISFYIVVLFMIFTFIHCLFKGDINHDNNISTLDIVVIQRYINGYDNKLSIYDKFLMDVNMDFKINKEDIDELRKIILNQPFRKE